MAFCNVLGIKVAVTNLKGAVHTVCRHLKEWKGQYITFVNAYVAVLNVEDEAFGEAQRQAVAHLADGYPIAKYQKGCGYPDAERVSGPDFMEEIFRISAGEGYRHYFYGSSARVLDQLLANLARTYPGMVVAGSYSPPALEEITKELVEEAAARINPTQPDFVWIGLGTPKQDLFMCAAKGKIDGLMLGVGVGFDFHAQTLKRAPKRMRDAGWEWLYRMIKEPRRLVWRYVRTNTKYIRLCIAERLKGALRRQS